MSSEDNDERTTYWDLWARYPVAPDGEGRLGLLRQAVRIRQARVQRYSDICVGLLLDRVFPAARPNGMGLI